MIRLDQHPLSNRNSDSRTIAWITGAAGLIGGYIVRAAPAIAPDRQPLEVRALTRRELDLLHFDSVRAAFRADQPELVIHCAAMAQSPACDKDPALARRINVDATSFLAELAVDIPFIFFSSDLVFDGRKGNYVESDEVNPLSVYAETKVEAERIVLANPRHTVIRTSLNAGISLSGDRGFNEQLRRAFERGVTLRLFTDEFRNPIPAENTARAVWELVQQNARGLFHVAGSERLSRWEMGQLLAKRWPELKPKIEPESISNYQGPARPPDTSLNCDRAQASLSFSLARFSEWLAHSPREAL